MSALHLPNRRPTSEAPWGGALLVYFSSHGHTASVAARIADTLVQHGLYVDIHDIADAGDVDPERHDVVVVGVSPQREPDRQVVVDWISKHRVALSDRPTAFFSVPLPEGAGAEDPKWARRCLDDFLAETGWYPTRSTAVTGARAVERFADELAILAATPLAA